MANTNPLSMGQLLKAKSTPLNEKEQNCKHAFENEAGVKSIFSSQASVPFGQDEVEIEQALVKFVQDLCCSPEMLHVRNLFVVPVGLPGMGKSTFSKHLKRTTSNHFQR